MTCTQEVGLRRQEVTRNIAIRRPICTKLHMRDKEPGRAHVIHDMPVEGGGREVPYNAACSFN